MTLNEINNLEGLNAHDIIKKLKDREAMAFNPELVGFKKLNKEFSAEFISYSKDVLGSVIKIYAHYSKDQDTWLFQRRFQLHRTFEVNLKVPSHAWGVEFLTNAGVI
jgi:hypothetical protein